MGQVEDEFHFLCICTNYSDLREVLYIKAACVFPAFSILDELEKFVYLLNNLQRHVHPCAKVMALFLICENFQTLAFSNFLKMWVFQVEVLVSICLKFHWNRP